MQIRRLSSADADFQEKFRSLVAVDASVDPEITRRAEAIVEDVKKRGDAAVLEYTARFDRLPAEKLTDLMITAEEMHEALVTLPEDQRKALEEAAERIRVFHEKELEVSFSMTDAMGSVLGQRITSIDSVGLYVPGGKAAYPSSVLMNAMPARVAGVKRIEMTVPTPGGEKNQLVLAAASLAGVTRAFTIGGAQAIAMFAYGAKGSEPQDGEILCDPVDKITGPGNIFVATAKRMVSGIVGIDAVAGPTEIAIIADKGANPSWLAADLIGQAEHDELAGSVLITDSEDIADKVQESLKYRVPRTEHAERVNTSLRGRQSGIILTDGIEQSIDAANAYAAEHLEVQTADPDAVIAKIRNAGAIFRGPYSPVPLGDYMSGSNHVLPTSGTARFAAGLGVHTFMKPVEVIEYDEQGLKTLAARVNAFAVSEDLPAHGECVLSRFIDDPYNKATIKDQEEQAGLR